MKKGLLIVLEGIDACGKGTQLDLLADRLGREGELGAFKHKEPNVKTRMGELFYEQLADKWEPVIKGDVCCEDTAMPASDKALILQALQYYSVATWAPLLASKMEAGRHVLVDRYWPSGLVYAKAEGMDVEPLEVANTMALQPDLCVLIDIPVEESKIRRPDRRDRYETNEPFLRQVREEYLTLFDKRAAKGEPWVIINGLQSPETVHQLTWQRVKERLNER